MQIVVNVSYPQPLDFLAKVSALIPLPGTNLLRYNGQFAPQGRWRSKVVVAPGKRKSTPSAEASEEQKRKKMSWASLLKRSFAIDILECSKCGGRRELIALIEHDKTVSRILDHVGITSTPPRFKPARPPPQELWPEHTWA